MEPSVGCRPGPVKGPVENAPSMGLSTGWKRPPRVILNGSMGLDGARWGLDGVWVRSDDSRVIRRRDRGGRQGLVADIPSRSPRTPGYGAGGRGAQGRPTSQQKRSLILVIRAGGRAMRRRGVPPVVVTAGSRGGASAPPTVAIPSRPLGRPPSSALPGQRTQAEKWGHQQPFEKVMRISGGRPRWFQKKSRLPKTRVAEKARPAVSETPTETAVASPSPRPHTLANPASLDPPP